jgi:hypothetical protein
MTGCMYESLLTMPMHFTNSARLDIEVGSSHGLGDGEVARVSYAHLATGRVDRLLSKHLVAELQLRLLVAFGVFGNFLINRVGALSLENVLLRVGRGAEDFWVDPEVLSEHGFGRVCNPVGEQEGGVLGEVAVVEDEEEFGTVRAQALQRVGVARWEVPQVALLKVIDKATALGVERGDADLAFKDVGPLGFLVPMKLADDAFVKTHVDTSKLLARTKLANGCLTGPAALFDSNVRVCKGPAHIGNRTMIGAGWAN